MASTALRTTSLLGSQLAGNNGLSPRQPLSRAIVRCMAENGPAENAPKVSPPTSGKISNPEAQVQTPKAQPKASTGFGDIFAFSGPAPETINGRLAMLGFVTAIAVEGSTGEGLVSQLQNGGLEWFAFAALLFSAASLVPTFQGSSAKSLSKGFFSANAEMWNGRAAMMGLVALAVTEYVKGTPLI